jgi:hypothetical protein
MKRLALSGMAGLLLVASAVQTAPAADFNGTWQTSYGSMLLTQEGNQVDGFYVWEGLIGELEGTVKGSRLDFTFTEGEDTGEGWYEMADDGTSWSGKWHETGDDQWYAWVGTVMEPEGAVPNYEGLWYSSYGRIRLTQDGRQVTGVYDFGGHSALEGVIQDRRLVYRYTDKTGGGTGWFDIAADNTLMRGRWKNASGRQTGRWTCARSPVRSGVVWLVIIEARWEESLEAQEYSAGEMLRAFMARRENVKVRHRIFNDLDDLHRWCRECAYIPEPVYLVIATHGNTEGIGVHGQLIGVEGIAEALRGATNIRLVHFASCLMMKDKLPRQLIQKLGQHARFPISGYTHAVGWGGAAVAEFMYFDLILSRGLAPEEAAEQLPLLLPFCKEDELPGSVVRPLGFKMIEPQ